jgi:hypothetical protein
MTSIHVDFNDFDEAGRLTALADDAHGPVIPGQAVILRDGDGNQCQADVVGVTASGVVFCEIRWNTWNKVNTLLDALKQLADEATAFKPDLPFAPRPSGLDPKRLPMKHKVFTG